MKKRVLALICTALIMMSSYTTALAIEDSDVEKIAEKPQTSATTTTTSATMVTTTTTKAMTGKKLATTTADKSKVVTTAKTVKTALQTTPVTSEITTTTPQTEVAEDNSNKVFVTKEQLAEAKLSGNDIDIAAITSEGYSYIWSIKAITITDTDKDIELTLSEKSGQSSKIKSILPNDCRYMMLSFNYSGKLPFSADVTVVNHSLPDGDYYFYYFNKARSSGVYEQGISVSNGLIRFSISHCSDYFITDKMISAQASNGVDSYVKILVMVGIAIIIAIALGMLVSKLRGKLDKMNKPEMSGEDVDENTFVKIAKENDFFVTEDFDDVVYEEANCDDLVLTDEDDEEIDKILYEVKSSDDDLLIFNDIDELDKSEYVDFGVGSDIEFCDEPIEYEDYKRNEQADIEGMVIGDTDETITDYSSYENAYQSNCDGLIVSDDDISDYDYADYEANTDPMYGLVLTQNEYEEQNLPFTYDEDLLLEIDEGYKEVDIEEPENEGFLVEPDTTLNRKKKIKSIFNHNK